MTVAMIDQETSEPPDQEAAAEPSEVGSERAMLGACLYAAAVSSEAAHALVDDLAALAGPADLFHQGHVRIWQALVDATAEGAPCDPAAVSARVLGDGLPGGPAVAGLITSLIGAACPQAAAPWHARKVAAAATARRLAAAGRAITQRALAPGFDPDTDGPAAQTALERATAGAQVGSAVRVAEVIERAVDLIEHPERIAVIPTGLDDLDMLYPGLAPGQLVIVAARPSIGKSVLALTIANNAAVRLGEPTLLFSLEMDRLQVTQRLISARARVDLGRILAGSCDDGDWARIARHLPAIGDAPLTIDDTPELTVGQIRAQVRRAARSGLRLVIIDYLQLITIPGRSESRQAAVDDLARQLKVLAGECKVPIVLLSQLNRGPEQRSDKRPMLSDLRESGGIENHADVAILIHRPDFYDPEDRAGEADLVVAKHRNGRTGTATAAFQGHYARLVSMAGWQI